MSVLVLVVPVLVLAAWAVHTYRRAGERADGWAAERGLELTEDGRRLVTWHLRTSRVLRVLGAIAGVVLTPLVALAFGHQGIPVWFQLPAPFVGYLVGVVYAEVSLRRPTAGRASMRPRELRGYLSPWALRSQRRTALLAAVMSAAALVVPTRDPIVLSAAGRVALAVAVLVTWAGVETVQRWLVRRPQPFVSSTVVEADDAVRRQSVHSIAGAATSIQWLLAGAALFALGGSEVAALRATTWLPALACWALAVVCCVRFERGRIQIRQVDEGVPAC